MEFLTQLWLPIVLSALLVFVASSIIHMVLQTHKSDYKKLKEEDDLLESMRVHGVEPGVYMFPCAGSMKEMGTPEMKAKMEKGPVGLMTVVPPGGFNIGKNLIIWFVYSLLVGIFAAYVAWHGLGGTEAEYLTVFRVVGAASFMGYALGHMHNGIWKGERWPTVFKFMFDGLVYALLTAGTFGWLWPG